MLNRDRLQKLVILGIAVGTLSSLPWLSRGLATRNLKDLLHAKPTTWEQIAVWAITGVWAVAGGLALGSLLLKTSGRTPLQPPQRPQSLEPLETGLEDNLGTLGFGLWSSIRDDANLDAGEAEALRLYVTEAREPVIVDLGMSDGEYLEFVAQLGRYGPEYFHSLLAEGMSPKLARLLTLEQYSRPSAPPPVTVDLGMTDSEYLELVQQLGHYGTQHFHSLVAGGIHPHEARRYVLAQRQDWPR